MKDVVTGVELAKNGFSRCPFYEDLLLRMELKSKRFFEFLAQQKLSPVISEACVATHDSAREMVALRHRVTLIAIR